MATWAALETGLPALFTSLLGLPVDFRTQPIGMRQGSRAYLDVVDVRTVGDDERVWANDGVTAVKETVLGLREMSIQVSVTSHSQELHESARFYLDRLKARLRWASSIASLKALGLALVDIEPVVQVDPTTDNRAVSRATMDIRFAYGVSETDAAIPFIETARIRSDLLRNPGGTAVTPQIDVTEP